MHDFNIADQNIEQKTPVKINATKYASKIGDVFRDQLIYTLASEAKYSSDVIADPTTLDFVWILLRNLGTFFIIKKVFSRAIRDKNLMH